MLRLLQELGSSAYAVRGNHDVRALEMYNQWVQNKSLDSSKWEWVKGMSQDDAQFLRELPYSLTISLGGGSDVIRIVHAGIVPGKALEEQNPRDLITVNMTVADIAGVSFSIIV